MNFLGFFYEMSEVQMKWSEKWGIIIGALYEIMLFHAKVFPKWLKSYIIGNDNKMLEVIFWLLQLNVMKVVFFHDETW